METLRGVFPKPKPPPKRNFLRENVLKVKESSSKHGKINEIVSNKQKLNLLKKNQRGKSLETLKNNGNDDFTIVSQDSTTQYTCLCSHNCRPCSRTSQLVDQSSQTMDVTSEIFLKDAIIRYPSSYTESLKSSEYINGNNSERCLDDQNDGDSKRKSFISNLNEFLETSSIKRNNKETCRSESCMEQPINSPSICYIKTPESPKLRKFSNTNTINQYNDVANLIANTNELTIEPPKTSSSLESANSNHSNISRCISKSESNISSQTQCSKSEIPSNYKRGEIPKYLIERKESITRQKELEKEVDPDCPKGHIALSEDERLESLAIAKKRFQDLINELNKLPMTMDTLKIRRRKIEIEKDLDSLESHIRIFSRQKVYVKIDE